MIGLFYKAVACIPLNLRILLGRICGYLYSLFPGRENTIASLQLKLHLKQNGAIIRAVFANLGQTVLECFNLRPYLDDIDRYVLCDNWQIAEELKADDRPIVVLTAHTANWDLLAAYAIKKGFRVSTIARETRYPALQELLVRIRDSYGIETIWKDQPSSTRQILKALKSKTILAALIDQDLGGPGCFAPFFNMPAKYPDSLISLAKKSRAHIITAFIFREKTKRYRIALHKLDAENPAQEIINQYSALLESYVRQYPDQWVWFHKRWRSKKDGRRLSGKDYIKELKLLLESESSQTLEANR